MPFGDRGAGKGAQKPHDSEEKEKYDSIQNFLSQQGFTKIIFEGLDDQCIDAFWNFETQDYKKIFHEDTKAFRDNLENIFAQNKQIKMVVLMQDFDFNHQLFNVTMEFLSDKEVVFIPAT